MADEGHVENEKDTIMNGLQGLSRAAKSNMKICREKAHKAQEQKSPFATFAHLGGHFVGANSLGRLGLRREGVVI